MTLNGKSPVKFVKYLLILAVCCILLGAGSIYGLYRYIEPQLPDVATLKDVRLQIPMQVYSADGELIAQYGEKRRIPVTLDQIPPEMINAFIATEDSRFYEHHGIDPVGIFRAASVALFSGHASQGASTITQQLARNFFLSPERTLMRKIKEAFLAIRIEQLLNKNEILELYLNKIYLGYRAYGVGAAAQVYFGKTVDQLSLSEMAVIAGLPKAPSTFNPLYSMDRAIARRNVVLSRMLSEGYITQAQYDQARSEPIDANYHAPEIAFSAPYLSEMVRQEMYNRYGESAYEDGYRIYTTITRKVQQAAQQAVRNNVLDYDMRHGYRGPANVLWKVGETAWDSKKITDTLKALPTYGPLLPAVVTSANPQEATAALADGTSVSLHMEGMRWARPYRSDTQQGLTLASMLNDVPISRWDAGAGSDWRPKNSPPQYAGPIRLRQGLGQSKNVVMVRAMRAMGVDYAAEYLQRFGFPAQNIVHTESLALGSASFTPMQVARGYAVMANGGFLIDPYFISKIENDQGGVIFEAKPKIACPECDIPVIYGNTQKSDVLENTNVEEVAVSQEQQNSAVPMPELEQANQALVAQNGTQEYAPHVINTPLAFLIKSALNTNIFGEPGWMGTGWRAARDLKRRDIGGKTGTTNSSKDAWFSGYGPGVVTSVWIGFDDHRRDLGRTTASGAIKDQISGYEGGAKSAQPAWDAYMKAVLEGVPEQPLTPPPGIVTVNIDRSTGQLASGGNSREEYFIEGTQPTQQAVHEVGTTIIDNGETHELF
ncbi:penicillin-binding protein 1A [Salmonella enterica]|nr:penicillin-binding protein 1A [Salmonella enterica]